MRIRRLRVAMPELRLVGGDIADAADTEQHDVDAAEGLDALLIEAAELLHLVLSDATIEGIDVLCGNIHLVEEALAELVNAADGAVGLKREILVGIEHDNILEAHLLFVVKADELIVDGREALSGTEAQHAVLAQLLLGLDFLDDGVGYGTCTFIHLRVDVGLYFLVTCDLRAVYGRLRIVKLLRNLIEDDL